MHWSVSKALVSACVVVLAANMTHAATLTVLHRFHGSPADGANPVAGLVRDSAGNLYGTTENGGAYGHGTVFAVRASGLETLLHSFCPNVPACGGDGWRPVAGLLRDAHGNLYGTTLIGGTGSGTVFQLRPTGSAQWDETVIYAFSGAADGGSPEAGLIQDAHGRLYGTTYAANGMSPTGVAFKLTPATATPWTEAVLHTFNGGNDGAGPVAGMIADSKGRLYGTTMTGGATPTGAAHGVVVRLTPSASGSWTEELLYTLTGGGDGGYPAAGLIMDAAGHLYGTAESGGINGGNGVVFELTPGASGTWTQTVLYAFCAAADCADGWSPQAGLVMDSQGNLYGTTSYGGAGGPPGRYGVVFELTPIPSGGWTETVLYTFSGGSDGANPAAGLVLDTDGNLYGTTSSGGDSACNCGTVFKLTP